MQKFGNKLTIFLFNSQLEQISNKVFTESSFLLKLPTVWTIHLVEFDLVFLGKVASLGALKGSKDIPADVLPWLSKFSVCRPLRSTAELLHSLLFCVIKILIQIHKNIMIHQQGDNGSKFMVSSPMLVSTVSSSSFLKILTNLHTTYRSL